MKPIKFKEHNVVYAKDQPQYNPLPGLKFDSEEGEFIACYGLSFWERLKVLFTGKVWVCLLTFNKPLTPSYLSVNRKDVYSKPSDKLSIWSKVKGYFI